MPTAVDLAGLVAIVATTLAVTRARVAQALPYLGISLLAIAAVCLLLGAAVVAACEAAAGAGLIALAAPAVRRLGRETGAGREGREPGRWLWPSLLALTLFAAIGYVLTHEGLTALAGSAATGPREVALVLSGPYLAGTILAVMLLLAGLLAAAHILRPPGDAR